MLPFHVGKQAASDAIRHWIATRWFAPDALKRFASPGAITGVYIPFWTFDAFARSYYTGQRGDYYYETEYYTTTDSNGNTITQSRQVQRIRWWPASGNVERWFDDILIPATKALPQGKLRELEPWDLKELKPYDPAFLSGYKAQRYQIELPQGFDLAKEIATKVISNDVRADIGGDQQRVFDIKTQYSAITFKHILMPVYVGAYRLNEKLYQVIVNARTGEVQGERPYSWVKITLAVLLGLALLFGLLCMFGAFEPGSSSNTSPPRYGTKSQVLPEPPMQQFHLPASDGKSSKSQPPDQYLMFS